MRNFYLLLITVLPLFIAAQNVGIGVSSPSHKLDISGDFRTTGQYRMEQTGDIMRSIGSGTKTWRIDNGDLRVWSGDGGSEIIRFESTNGNVGIGSVTSPAEKLHINGSIRGNQSGAIRISTGSGYVDIGPKNSSWSHFYTDRPRFWFEKGITVNGGNIGSHNNDDLNLQTDGTTRIKVQDSDGNVGIGNTSPDSRLDVDGAIRADNYRDNSGNDLLRSDDNTLKINEDNDGSWNLMLNSSFHDPKEPFESGALGALAPKIVMYNTTVNYGTVEDNTKIYRNGNLEIDAANPTTGNFSAKQGDIITSNKPIGLIDNGTGQVIPPVTAASLYHVFHSNRGKPHTVYIYTPSGPAEVEYYLNNFQSSGTADQTITLQPNEVKTLSLPNEGDHRFYSTAPVVMSKKGNPSDHIFIPPASKQVMHANSETALAMENVSINSTNSILFEAEAPLSVTSIADGSGSDSELGLPVSMMGDAYIISHDVADYAVASAEANTIRVYTWNGSSFVLDNEIDHSSASRSNPLKTSVGDQSGASSPTLTGPVYFVAKAPFYLRLNDPSNADEYVAIGYRQADRDFISQNGNFIRKGDAAGGDLSGTFPNPSVDNSGQLDGNDGSFYLNWNNFTNIPGDIADGDDDNQDLTNVLSQGNSAGSNNIDMSDQNINDANTVQANTLVDPEDGTLTVNDILQVSDHVNIPNNNEVVMRFDNGSDFITVHDGYGNFNILSGIDGNNNIVGATGGGARLEFNESGWFDMETYDGSANKENHLFFDQSRFQMGRDQGSVNTTSGINVAIGRKIDLSAGSGDEFDAHIGIGQNADVSSSASGFAFGYNVSAAGDYNMAVGINSTTSGGSGAHVFGNQSTASAQDAYAIGDNVTASASHAFAIGEGHTNSISNSIQLGVNGSASIFIDSDNAVGIGNTNPIYDLDVDDVDGSNLVQISVGDELIVDDTTNGAFSNIGFPQDVTPGGSTSFDVGNNTAGEEWDDMVADDFVTFSDSSVKQNIHPLSYGLNEIMALETVSYEYKDMPEDGRKLGLVAQQVLPVINEVVKTHDVDRNKETGELVKRKVDVMGIDYTKLVPVLIKAVQEQQKTIQKLKQEDQRQMEELRAEIEALKEEIKD